MAPRQALLTAFLLSAIAGPFPTTPAGTGDLPDIGDRREIFVDRYLIAALDGVRLNLHEPRSAGVALKLERPWEGIVSGYFTVLHDEGKYRMYYRGRPTTSRRDGEPEAREVTCYAESADGKTWTRPRLRLHEVDGTLDNNVILTAPASVTHNFAPFVDRRPGVPTEERYKAVGGLSTTGLLGYVSADGIRWKKLRDEPLLKKGAFDSQNNVFWSPAEKVYVCFFRTWKNGVRWISRSTSKDFRDWTVPVDMDFGDAPHEHLYTNQTEPYFRAPHIYVGTAARFQPGRWALTKAQEEEIGLDDPRNYESLDGGISDSVLITSRGGNRYDRTFLESLVRPGGDLRNWVARSNYPARGVVPTGPREMSFFVQRHYGQPSAHVERFTFRVDGFTSVHAPYRGGEMLTRTFRFAGERLEINHATAPAGGVRVEIQDENGQAVAGHDLDDCDEIIGDEIARVVTWKGKADVSALAGRPVRLRFAMRDADLYSLRFRPRSSVRAGGSAAALIGSRVAGVTLEDIDGDTHDVGPGGAHAATVLAWTGNACPMAKVQLPRLRAMAREYGVKGVRFFLINSNSHDSLDEIKALARDRQPGFPVVRDAGAELARRLRVERTTEVLLVDGRGVLRYRGAVNDQYGFRSLAAGRGAFRRKAPLVPYLREALDAVLADRAVTRPMTEAHGCAIHITSDRNDATRSDGKAGDITFHEHVEPLLQQHCADCHRPRGGAPFPLLEYDDVKGWAAMVREVVEERRMPPWNADPRHGKFSNERRLPAAAIETLVSWVDAGAPRGDPAKAPPRRVWKEGWQIGEPDIVYSTAPHLVPPEGTLPYRYAWVKTEFEEDRWVEAAQISSTSPEVVHHVLVFVDDRKRGETAGRPWTPPFNVFDLLQGAQPSEYGRWIKKYRKLIRRDLGIGLAGGLNGYFLAALPGDRPTVFPRERGKLLPAGATVIFQIHYTPDGAERSSATSLALRFAKERPREALDVRAAATVVFEIPPGAENHEVQASYTFPRGATLLSLRPHMHLRGKSFEYVAAYPGGARETLLSVPHFDFDWQFEYVLAESKHLPRGTRLEVTGTFDNSAGNPANPDPNDTVHFGLQTWEEMLIGYFEVIWDQETAEGEPAG